MFTGCSYCESILTKECQVFLLGGCSCQGCSCWVCVCSSWECILAMEGIPQDRCSCQEAASVCFRQGIHYICLDIYIYICMYKYTHTHTHIYNIYIIYIYIYNNNIYDEHIAVCRRSHWHGAAAPASPTDNLRLLDLLVQPSTGDRFPSELCIPLDIRRSKPENRGTPQVTL